MQVAESFSYSGEKSTLKQVPQASRLHAAKALTEIFNRIVLKIEYRYQHGSFFLILNATVF